MWSSMLDSVASGKKLPEKNIVVLGGSPETQKEFLETLASDAPKRPQDRTGESLLLRMNLRWDTHTRMFLMLIMKVTFFVRPVHN